MLEERANKAAADAEQLTGRLEDCQYQLGELQMQLNQSLQRQADRTARISGMQAQQGLPAGGGAGSAAPSAGTTGPDAGMGTGAGPGVTEPEGHAAAAGAASGARAAGAGAGAGAAGAGAGAGPAGAGTGAWPQPAPGAGMTSALQRLLSTGGLDAGFGLPEVQTSLEQLHQAVVSAADVLNAHCHKHGLAQAQHHMMNQRHLQLQACVNGGVWRASATDFLLRGLVARCAGCNDAFAIAAKAYN